MKKTFCVLGMVVTLLLSLFCVAMLSVFVTQGYSMANYRDWVATEGKVTSLVLVRQPRGYEAQMECIYQVNGTKYEDERSAWMRGEASRSLDVAKRDIVQKLGLNRLKWIAMDGNTHRAVIDDNNSHVTISYHPVFPSHGFYAGIYRPEIEHQIALNNNVGILFVVLLAVFAGGFYLCLRVFRRMKPQAIDENPFADEIPS